jgi:hypothetical protein
VAALRIYPLRVNPVTNEARLLRSLRLEIRFSQPAVRAANIPQLPTEPFDQVLQTTLLNPEALQWMTTAPADLSRLVRTETDFLRDGNTFKIVINEPGLYAVTYADLAAIGLPVDTLDPRTFRLRYGWPRQGVALLIEGEGDGQFNPSDRLLFYAEPAFSRYTSEAVYFLSYEEGSGWPRMGNRGGNPTGLAAGSAWVTAETEENHYYDSLYAGHDGDHWYWDRLSRPDRATGNYVLALPSPAQTGTTATLTLRLRGYTDPFPAPDHRLQIAINGAFLGEKVWDGAQAIEAVFSVPASQLVTGSNTISLSLPGVSGVTAAASISGPPT